MFVVGFGLYIGVGIEYLQNLVVGVVIVPAMQGVIGEQLDLQPSGPGHRLGLPLHPTQSVNAVDKITQLVPDIGLLAAPRGQVGELVQFVADQAEVRHSET